MYSTYQWQNRGFYFDLDSIESAYFTAAKSSGHTPSAYFYVAALGWKGDTVRYVIMRSRDLGASWTTLIDQFVNTNTDRIRKLKSFSSYDYGDSVKLLLAYEYNDTSNGTYTIYFSSYIDTMGDNLAARASFESIPINGQTHIAASLSETMDLIAYTDTGLLKIAYSTDNWATHTTVDYPYNSDYDNINNLDIVKWSVIWSYGGFNLAYSATTAGYIDIFYDEILINSTGDSITFNTPVKVSDSSVYTYIFNLSPYYHMKIANRADYNTPYIVWHTDYSHYSTPIFYYDSTMFFMDYMSNVQIDEKNIAKNGMTSKLITSRNGNMLSISAGKLENIVLTNIIDISGRVIVSKPLQFRKGRANLNINNLKNGLYFVVVKSKNITYRGKFLKIQ